MTAKKSRRVVIINDIKSGMIEQAIFILKTDAMDRSLPVRHDIVAEAQDIINHYVRTVEKTSFGAQPPSKRGAPAWRRAAYVLLAVCGSAVALGLATWLTNLLLAAVSLS